MHDQPLWVNKLLLPPAIKNKWMEIPITDRLAALTKHIAELRQTGLEACYCVKDFYLRWIRSLGRRMILALKCPRMANPYCEPSKGCLFVLSPHC
jgi:hypothetical protein